MGEANRRKAAGTFGKPEPAKLIRIGAFWNNNVAGGLGLLITSDADFVASVINDALVEYRKPENKQHTEHYLDQLQEWGRRVEAGEKLPAGEFVVAMTNIAYLEEIGAIEPDDFNGMQYSYVAPKKDNDVSGVQFLKGDVSVIPGVPTGYLIKLTDNVLLLEGRRMTLAELVSRLQKQLTTNVGIIEIKGTGHYYCLAIHKKGGCMCNIISHPLERYSLNDIQRIANELNRQAVREGGKI